MAKISTYPLEGAPKLSDKLIGTSVGTNTIGLKDPTYNFSLQKLLDLFLPNIPANNLQGILNYGNTATQDINLFGTIYTTNLEVSDTATLFKSYFTEEVYFEGLVFDSNNSSGTLGQIISNNGNGIEWVTPVDYIPSLQEVLVVGNIADIDIVLSSDISAEGVIANTITSNNSIYIGGGLYDWADSLGTSGQMLISLGDKVEWQDVPLYTATSPLSINPATKVVSIQQANGTQNGYLSFVDWITFDGKQPAGNYITSLTGEATASGPGASSVTLNNAAVISKVLSGLNITGGTVNSTDSILVAFGKVQSQINGLIGGVQYQGVWNANTNTPVLTSGVGTQGHYYIVNVEGNTNLNGITDWKVGDWAIFSDGSWQKVDNSDSVTSVNGEVGAVSLTTDNIPEGLTNLYYLNSRARAALSFVAGSGAYNSTTGVITIPTNNNQIANGSNFITLSSLSANGPLSYDSLLGLFSIAQSNVAADGYLSSSNFNYFSSKVNPSRQVNTVGPLQGGGDLSANLSLSIDEAGTTTDGYLSQTDWNTFNSKQNSLSGTGLVKSTSGTITYITDNSSNWDTAYNNSIVSASVTGTSTKTLTLNQQDGGTITADWSDSDTGLTSVGVSMPSAFSVSNSPLTSNGTIAITGLGNTSQYVDGTGALQTFPSISNEAQGLIREVYNETGATLVKGTVVIIDTGHGNLPSVAKAIATSDLTSAQTFGLVQNDISDNDNGFVICAGGLDNLDTDGLGVGSALYLSSTIAGEYTTVKQYAPAHLVYIGVVVRDHPTQGIIEVKIQNGYEMDELHNVSAQNPNNNDILQYNTSTNLWESIEGTTTNISEGSNLYYLDSRARAALSASSPLNYNSTTGAFTITQSNSTTDGYLSSADWTTFNNKQNALTIGNLTSSSSPILQISGGTNSIIGSGVSIAIQQASGISGGYLSSIDWNTFNDKQDAITLTTTGSSGASSFISGTLNIPNYTLSGLGGVPTSRLLTINGTQYDLSVDRSWSVGTVTSVAALTLGTSGTDLSSTVATGTTTPVITLNVPTASSSNRGALSSTDWSTFNNKVGNVTASSPLASSGGASPNITIQQSSGSQAGFLSAADWSTFNNKQPAGNYITSLTGEVSASGPGAASATLNNASVTGKVLTGVNVTGGSIASTDTMLTAFGKLQNQINSLVGGSIYQGTWNASTNTPTLTSSVGTNGYYYIVSVAGSTNLNGITDWKVGDWAIFHGSTWQKVDNTDAVSSVNGQTGAVSLTTDNISEGSSNLYFLNSRARGAVSFTAGSGAYNSTTGVFTIPTNTNQLTNGASFITLGSLSGVAPISYNSGTGAISISQAGSGSNGFLSSTDWNTFNNKQAALGGTGIVLSTGGTISYLTNNSGNWNTAYNDSIVSAAFTGTTTKTLTLTQQDGGTVTASFTDANSGGTVTSVSGTGGYGGLTLSGTVTTSGNLTLGGTPTGTWPINITGNAETVDGYSASQSTVANNIVVRDGNGYIFGNYINMTDDGNPGSGSSISSFITKQGDNYYRAASPTNAANTIRGAASGSWPISISGNSNTASSASSVSGVVLNRIVYGDGERKSTSQGNMNAYNQYSGFFFENQPTGNPFGDWTNWINVMGNSWDNNYGYQLAHAFHSDQFAVRRVTNGTFYDWRTIITSGNISSQSVNFATTASSAAYASSAGYAGSVAINYNNDSDSNYQMLWGSGNSVYGTGGITCNPFTDTINQTVYNSDYGFNMSTQAGRINYGPNNSVGVGFKSTNSTYSENAYINFNGAGGADSGSFWTLSTYQLYFGTPQGGGQGGGYAYYAKSGVSVYEPGTYGGTANHDYNAVSFYSNYYGEGLRCEAYSAGDLYIGGVLIQNAYSDAKYKENVVEIETALDKLKSIRGVEYDWNELALQQAGKSGHDVGVIAQEVQAVYPFAVREVDKEKDDHIQTALVVDYDKLIPLLLQSIKELSAEVDVLKDKLKNL